MLRVWVLRVWVLRVWVLRVWVLRVWVLRVSVLRVWVLRVWVLRVWVLRVWVLRAQWTAWGDSGTHGERDFVILVLKNGLLGGPPPKGHGPRKNTQIQAAWSEYTT